MRITKHDLRTAKTLAVYLSKNDPNKVCDEFIHVLKQMDYVIVPVTPSKGLLVSMALRQDHDFGVPYSRNEQGIEVGLTTEQRKARLSQMAQLHEEVVGTGFYREEKEDEYRAYVQEN